MGFFHFQGYVCIRTSEPVSGSGGGLVALLPYPLSPFSLSDLLFYYYDSLSLWVNEFNVGESEWKMERAVFSLAHYKLKRKRNWQCDGIMCLPWWHTHSYSRCACLVVGLQGGRRSVDVTMRARQDSEQGDRSQPTFTLASPFSRSTKRSQNMCTMTTYFF